MTYRNDEGKGARNGNTVVTLKLATLFRLKRKYVVALQHCECESIYSGFLVDAKLAQWAEAMDRTVIYSNNVSVYIRFYSKFRTEFKTLLEKTKMNFCYSFASSFSSTVKAVQGSISNNIERRRCSFCKRLLSSPLPSKHNSALFFGIS